VKATRKRNASGALMRTAKRRSHGEAVKPDAMQFRKSAAAVRIDNP
jgi:hypothetical protein